MSVQDGEDVDGAIPTSSSGGGTGRTVYRSMREAADGDPMVGPTARTLGVRPGDDLPVVQGRVRPGTGGLSVAPDRPSSLPSHRRPAEFGGTGKDPVWGITTDSLGIGLTFRQDKAEHGLFEPAREMSIEDFQAELADLAPLWFKI